VFINPGVHQSSRYGLGPIVWLPQWAFNSSNKIIDILRIYLQCSNFVQMIEKSETKSRHRVLKEIEIFHHCQGHENILQMMEYFEEDDKYVFVCMFV